MVEKKCIEIVKQQNEKPEELTGLQWQALTALHRTLLHEHHDFFLASNHPMASETLKELAKTYSMPARMWRYGIHSFLELLRKKLPSSLDHMLTFIYMAYAMITLLYESVPAFQETWIECLGDLARYRMAIEEVDMRDREIYTGVARYWYTKAADLNPNIGRIQHHLAVLARPNQLQQLFYYSKALISVQPFTNARDSILLLFSPLLDPARAATKYSKYYPRVLTLFVEAHGALFTRQADISTFQTPAEQFLDQLDKHAGIIGALFREQGVYIAAANFAAIFDFGHDNAALPSMFNGLGQKSDILDNARRYWKEDCACVQTGIAQRSHGNQHISGQVVSLASHFAFTTMDVILERVGDKNTLPFFHVSLSFLWCAAMVPESMSYIQADVPWARLATFLNGLIRPEMDMSEIVENEDAFPPQEPGVSSQQLPEDFLIHGLCWSQLYYPAGFFSDIAEDDERSIELPSVAVPRTRRCLWLGARIASVRSPLTFFTHRIYIFFLTCIVQPLDCLRLREPYVLVHSFRKRSRDTLWTAPVPTQRIDWAGCGYFDGRYIESTVCL
jgi:Est1 DNA/RNA binding domain